MKIGICGGTFDPFHRGHLEPVLAARESMQWDRILYFVAYRQPFKEKGCSASGYHRFAMAALATESIDDVWVSSWELEREGVSYTVDTLEHLRSEYPDATLDWIIGDDNLARLGEWKRIDRIFELANFVVLTRLANGDDGAATPDCVCDAATRPPHGAIAYAENATVPISSTEIRRRVRAGESIDALVDPRVSRYIQHNRLYQETS
ncbi:MAG TPA: nicotinate (nicotinamide) nucleotide adenylyltransferase [Thermoanaerobaculia bacterium]|jgi:nicotinate-nucleotide adenylyltransferase|nr:nicotinate (nicotinamide) nucleotide adenylyltransferase [Thermoanaerobaculia bacterium]